MIDLNKQYYIPMVKRGGLADSAVYLPVKITPIFREVKGKNTLVFIRASVDDPEYEQLGFYPQYFEWLVDVSHYIKTESPENPLENNLEDQAM